MLDFLLISPLGWEPSVWNKLTSQYPDKSFEILTYTDQTLDSFTEQEDFMRQIDQIRLKISDSTIVIAASFGTIVLLKYLSLKPLTNNVILIEGFHPLPTMEELTASFSNRMEQYSSQTAYLNTMLDEEEQKNPELVEIILDNLSPTLQVITSNRNSIKCLSLFNQENTIALLKQVYHQNFTIFNSFELEGFDVMPIDPQDHLLMLTDPQKLCWAINNL